MLVHLQTSGAHQTAATRQRGADEVLHAPTRSRPSTAPAGGRASLETNATVVTASTRPSTAGARRPTCFFGATRGAMMKKEHSHKFMTLKGSSLGHSNDLSLFERKAMETQMFRKAQEAKARQGSRRSRLEEPRPGEMRGLLDLDGLQVRHGEQSRRGAPTRHKTRNNEGEFHKHHDDPNKPPTPRKPPPPMGVRARGYDRLRPRRRRDAFREFEALLDRDAKSRRRPQSAPAASILKSQT